MERDYATASLSLTCDEFDFFIENTVSAYEELIKKVVVDFERGQPVIRQQLVRVTNEDFGAYAQSTAMVQKIDYLGVVYQEDGRELERFRLQFRMVDCKWLPDKQSPQFTYEVTAEGE